MEIINIPQRSKEWFKLREKRMTASHAQAIGNCGKGLESYVTELMQEFYSTAEKKHFSNNHTDRGNELEYPAAFLYSTEIDEPTEKVGFVIHNDYVGCSPDLFVGSKGMAEIKCPADKEYFRLMLGGKIESKYIWQIQMQLLICEREYCDFVAYNPNFKNPIIIERVEICPKSRDKLLEGFRIGENLIKEIEKKINTFQG